MKAKKLAVRLCGPVLIIIIASVISVLIYSARTSRYNDWRAASAVVIEVRQYRTPGGRHFGSGSSHRIYYSYTIDDMAYTGSSSYSGYDSDFSKGDLTEVWYNPDNPEKSSFHKPGPGLDPYVPFFIGAPLAIAAFRLTGERKKK